MMRGTRFWHAYVKNFAHQDRKVWQGVGGRNRPPEAPHLVVTTPDIETLQPKSPMKDQKQMQQNQPSSISLTNAGSPIWTLAAETNCHQHGQSSFGFELVRRQPTWMEGFGVPECGSILPGDDTKASDTKGYGMPPNIGYFGFSSHPE